MGFEIYTVMKMVMIT